jgi:hypothetical protein
VRISADDPIEAKGLVSSTRQELRHHAALTSVAVTTDLLKKFDGVTL